MRRTRRHKRNRNKYKKIIIISSICLLFVMTAGYAAFSTNLNITAKGNIIEKDRVIQSWTRTSAEDFHSDYYRENIVSATFLNTEEIPSNATESWNVSEDKVKGGVMAWVIPNSSDSTKYDLYIGANKGIIANIDSSNLFYDFINLKVIDFNNNFDTSNTINMSGMFACVYDKTTSTYKKGALTNIYGLEFFDTSKVTNMTGMFYYTSELSSIDLSNFNTSNVTQMNSMFELSGVETLNLNNFDTRNVINMAWMFSNASNIIELNISNFNTSKVTSMAGMFSNCKKLTSLNLSNFDTRNVTSMAWMFENCKNIITLNLCNFNTSAVTDMRSMFSYNSKPQNVYVGPNWTTTNANTIGSDFSSIITGQC